MLSWKYSQIFLRIHIIVNIGEKLSWTMPPDVYLFPCCPRREEVLNVTTQKRKSVLFVDNWGIRYRKQHKHWKVHTYSWHVMDWWCCLIVEQPTLSSCPECVAFASYATEETYWKLSYRGNIFYTFIGFLCQAICHVFERDVLFSLNSNVCTFPPVSKLSDLSGLT